MKRKTITWSVAATLLCAAGCVKPYPDMRLVSSVRIEHLDRSLSDDIDGIQVYDGSSTAGLFPTGIAVVRVTNVERQHPDMLVRGHDAAPSRALTAEPIAHAQSAPELAAYANEAVDAPGASSEGNTVAATAADGTYLLSPLRSFEATYWMELFDSTPEVREVVLLHHTSTRQPVTTLPELLRVSGIMQSGVLLVYGFDNLSMLDACRVTGLVYEVDTGRLVARIQQTTTVEGARRAALDVRKEERPDDDTDGDWAFYTDEVAFRLFERQVRECIWGMIDRDMPAGGQTPNPYENPRGPYPASIPPWLRLYPAR